MSRVHEPVPPRWHDSMRLRRSCLFRWQSERALTNAEACSCARDLISSHGVGEWDYVVVQLDSGACDWEFRFKPHRARRAPTRIDVWRS